MSPKSKEERGSKRLEGCKRGAGGIASLSEKREDQGHPGCVWCKVLMKLPSGTWENGSLSGSPFFNNSCIGASLEAQW